MAMLYIKEFRNKKDNIITIICMIAGSTIGTIIGHLITKLF